MRETSDSIAFLPSCSYFGSRTLNTASEVAADRGAWWRGDIDVFPVVRKKLVHRKDDGYTNLWDSARLSRLSRECSRLVMPEWVLFGGPLCGH
jgi:hypothetical protein